MAIPVVIFSLYVTCPTNDELGRVFGKKRSVIFYHTLECNLTMSPQMLEGNMTVKPIVHEIRIQNQVIFLDPPIEYARSTWIKQLHDWLGERFLA